MNPEPEYISRILKKIEEDGLDWRHVTNQLVTITKESTAAMTLLEEKVKGFKETIERIENRVSTPFYKRAEFLFLIGVFILGGIAVWRGGCFETGDFSIGLCPSGTPVINGGGVRTTSIMQ